MSPHGHTAIRNPTSGPALAMDRGRRFVLAVTLVAGLFMTAAGFPRHTHFVDDAGAFQLGIGVTLLLAAAWRDGLALALAGFLVANTTHALNYAVDQGPARVRQAYPGSTWDRLVAIKDRYDPANLFRLNQNIPPTIKGAGQ